MRDYGRVYSSFWQSPEMRALPEDARTLALYLLTTPHGNLIGCFRLPEAYAAEDLQWDHGRVSEGFRKLAESGFLTRDEGTKWLHITKFLKWNAFENPNVAKAAHKAFEQVPSLSLKPALALALLDSGAHMSAEFRKACETLCEPFRKPEPEPEPEPEPIRNLKAPTALVGKQASRPPDCPADELIALYHEHLPMLPRVEVLSESRKRALSARWREVVSDQDIRKAEDVRAAGIDWFGWYFGHAAKSRFLTGKAKDWRADLDFLLTPGKWAKVIEGSYHKEAA